MQRATLTWKHKGFICGDDMKRFMPYILPSLLLAGILVLGYRKLIYHDVWSSFFHNLEIAAIVIYVLWILLELGVARRDVEQESAVRDYGTRELYGLSQCLTILSALWFDPLWRGPGIHQLAGFIVFIGGGILRIWAIRTLGEYYSHVVRTIDRHKIINTGPYRLLRHPAYTGMIIAHLGIVVLYLNYVSLLIFLLLLVPSIVIRILIEEKTLFGIEGYADFARDRKRIIPCVW
jgi:protein-S-isoprenylcysteine O-methyltransferase Ste14